jgi:type I restriction enzyme S subunit
MILASWPRYDRYKHSGEGWIEHVPAHWEIRKLKQLFQEKRHRSNLTLNCGAISFGEVVEKDDEQIPLATKKSYQEVLAGEFLVNPLNLNYDLKSLRIGLSEINVVVSAGYIVLQAKDELDKQYFKYLLHRYDVANMKLLGSGVRQTINFNHIANSILVAPPLPEQCAIAAFLDEKCAKIDEAIRIKEKQIALLRERRQIMIQQAVTRGLNPSVSMKDSGIDWIGQIPAHWEMRSIRYAFTIRNNQRIPISASERAGKQGEYPYYGASGIIDYVRDYIFDEDLILIAEDGANLLSKSTPLAFVATGKYWVNNHAHILEPLFPGFKYWAELLSAVDYTVYISGSAQPKLTKDRLGSVRVPVPPADERLDIISFIEEQNEKFVNAIAIKEEQIVALKEYKTSLINAAVTGKIKVDD